jgi:hypothetical protein
MAAHRCKNALGRRCTERAKQNLEYGISNFLRAGEREIVKLMMINHQDSPQQSFVGGPL